MDTNEINKNEELDKRVQKYEALKKFFAVDMKMKETLLQVAPTELDDSNEESRMKYIDKLYKQLKDFEIDFIDCAEKLEFAVSVKDAIKKHFAKSREMLLISRYDSGVIQKLYRELFSDMSSRLIEQVKENCVGYTCYEEGLEELLDSSKTVNELLHVMHSYVSNNEEILQSMPIIDAKENEEHYPITLYGEENEISKKIFKDFPLELKCGWTEIVSMENMILMMIRDRGHALTIDINTTKEEEIIIKYFIPKLCNIDMVKALPGINANKITNNGAVGIFKTSKDEISESLFEFIGKVPMDSDIPRTYTDEFIVESIDDAQKEIEEDNGEMIFNEEDAQDLAMEESENGRRVNALIKLKEKIGMSVRGLINKAKENKIGGNTDDRATRD